MKTELLRAFYEGRFPQDNEFRNILMEVPKVTVEKEEKPMYESPISISHLVEPMTEQYDDDLGNMIVQTCMKVGVDVDKDRLLKALEGDREQYYKGFADGRKLGRRWGEKQVKDLLREVIRISKEFIGLTDDELCDLIHDKPEDEEEV